MSEFKKIKRNEKGNVYQKHLYITYDTQCQCNCKCCRNKSFDNTIMKNNKQKIQKKIIEEASNFRHIVFGGGEPLLKIDEIAELIHNINRQNFQREYNEDEQILYSLATNGERSTFLAKIDENCTICAKFYQIILSRYHYDDDKNNLIFNSKTELINSVDLLNLCPSLKRKIQFSCLCQKSGVATIEDIKHYIEWVVELGFANIMFSNFQDEVTVSEAKKLGCDLSFLSDAQAMIEKDFGFQKETSILFSAGYKITNYTGFIPLELLNKSSIQMKNVKITVLFREFISEEELQKEWINARRKTYNYSIMPNGKMYSDWECRVEKK